MRRAIGIDLGGTKIAAAVIDESGQIQTEIKKPLPRTTEEALSTLIEIPERLFDDTIDAIGVGAPGLVKWPEGFFEYGPNVPFAQVPLVGLIQDHFQCHATVDNDANVAAYAEAKLGAAKSAEEAVVVTLGTGVGGAIISRGEIFHGTSFAGEIGHMQLDPQGPLCSCGRKGCFEALASGRALDRRAAEIVKNNPSGALAMEAKGVPPRGDMLTRCAEAGDADCIEAMCEAGRWLGIGLSNLAAILDPEIFVVGGGVSAAGPTLFDSARAVLKGSYGSEYRKSRPSLVRARFGNDAGVIGAGLLALHH